MKIVVSILSVLCLAQLLAIELGFDPSPSPNVTYLLHWVGKTNQAVGEIFLGTNRTIQLTNGPWGAYYFTAFASSSGALSSASNELLETNRPVPPSRLRARQLTRAVAIDAQLDGQSWQTVIVATNNQPPITNSQRTSAVFRLRDVKIPPPPFPP